MVQPPTFEWDEAEAASNAVKHKVMFLFATRLFLDPGRVELDVSRTEDGEARLKVIGVIDGRLYVVVCTSRGRLPDNLGASHYRHGGQGLW